MLSSRVLLLALSCSATAAAAADFDLSATPLQADFDKVSQDVIAAIDYKALGPAEAGGISGFSIGALATYAPVQDKGAWQRLTASNVDGVGMVGVSVVKGLPFDIDVGAFYTQVPGTDARVYGGELRYAILPGGVASPALALRASYIRLSGEDDIKAESKSVDASLSKGFAFLTPYAGVGYVQGRVTPNARFTLKEATVNKAKLFAGVRMTLGLLQFTPEYQRLGDSNVYSARLAIGF